MEKGQNIYEIGYLLSPLIPEEKLDEEISVLRKAIEDKQGFILSESRGKIHRLAYTIKAHGSSGKFDSAYFGWMKFTIEPEQLLETKNTLDKNNQLIRFLIVKAVKEQPARQMGIKRPAKKKMTAAEELKERGEVQTEEIDKKLEEILGV